MLTISVDAMSGDLGLKVTVPAVIRALNKFPQLNIIVVGQQDILERRLKSSLKKFNDRLCIQPATEVVEMDELPSKALRYKKDSSMRVAINLVKEGKANAAVSAGNTGALMATARFVLKTLPGVDRPAIVALIPSANRNQFVRMLDLGANIENTAEQLQQFAVMGSILASTADGVNNPRVGLLNIGSEEIKGNTQVKAAADLLAETKAVNYIGFVEGDDVFHDKADVIVSDGFVGNVALKVMEGETKFIRDQLKAALTESVMTKIGALFMLPVIQKMKKKMNPDRYNGASLLGLKGIVIKSHGTTSVRGFRVAIERAIAEVEHDVPKLISDQVQQLLSDTPKQ